MWSARKAFNRNDTLSKIYLEKQKFLAKICFIDTLSRFMKTPLDEKQFKTVADNYLRHAPKNASFAA